MTKAAAVRCLVALARCCALSLAVGIISYDFQSWYSSSENYQVKAAWLIQILKFAVPNPHMIVMVTMNLANAALYKNERMDGFFNSMAWLFIAVLAG